MRKPKKLKKNERRNPKESEPKGSKFRAKQKLQEADLDLDSLPLPQESSGEEK